MRTFITMFVIAIIFKSTDCYGQVDLNTIDAQANYLNEKLYLSFTNNGDNPIFLFSSYLDYHRSKLRYLYRINQSLDTVKISFLPIIPLLYCSESSLRFPYIDDNAADETMTTEALYDFIKINPKQTKDVIVCIQDLQSKITHIRDKDVDIKNMHINKVLKRPKPIKVKYDSIKEYLLEFAFYTSIDNINLDCYIDHPWRFNNAVKDYRILTISLTL